MKLHLENINTKVGKLADMVVELGEGDPKITVFFESPIQTVPVVDIDAEPQKFTRQEPMYNTIIVSGEKPFIAFSVHYDRRYIARRFRNSSF